MHLRSLHTRSEIFVCVFHIFRIRYPFLSKCLLRMRKRRKSNLILFFYDGRKFRRQCVNVIDTTWGRIYFSTCENFGRKFHTQCAIGSADPRLLGALRKTVSPAGGWMDEMHERMDEMHLSVSSRNSISSAAQYAFNSFFFLFLSRAFVKRLIFT